MAPKAKILIAGNEKEVVENLDELLRSYEFDTVSTCNGAEAVEAVRRERPDLVLFDIIMPGLDSYLACQILRRDSANLNLPIVILSGFAEESAVISALECGADDYLTKPFLDKEIFKSIERLLSCARQGLLPSQMHLKKPENSRISP